MSDQIHSLDAHHMDAFLERRRAVIAFASEMSLADNLAEILRKANEFVPSAAGSILLDNPLDKRPDKSHNLLTFVAAFGAKATRLIGTEIMANQGIAGQVYATGESYHTSNTDSDPYFFTGVDEMTQYSTESLVAIPIRIGQEVCGVLELMNRQGARDYSADDRNLLQIFAGYISISIQNILDGRRAQELAKRDNLTGLFNDHYLHVSLERTISRCLKEHRDLAVIFLDLDYFKQVNDTHGHLAGSQVLREVGHLLKSYVRNTDSVPARYGGDEFVLVIPDLRIDKALDLAEAIRINIVENTFCEQAGDIHREELNLTGLTCSIGVATLKKHVESNLSVADCKSNLLRLADTAMYVAKKTGRNRTAVAPQPVRRRTPTAEFQIVKPP
ncbi:MAG: sensor domain-containing diguanylate cyclase [bacterium]|nr:sensor domain-containing diguanylate cyclase [bacterium]